MRLPRARAEKCSYNLCRPWQDLSLEVLTLAHKHGPGRTARGARPGVHGPGRYTLMCGHRPRSPIAVYIFEMKPEGKDYKQRAWAAVGMFLLKIAKVAKLSHF